MGIGRIVRENKAGRSGIGAAGDEFDRVRRFGRGCGEEAGQHGEGGLGMAELEGEAAGGGGDRGGAGWLGQADEGHDGNGGEGGAVRKRRGQFEAGEAFLEPRRGAGEAGLRDEELGALAPMKFVQKLVYLGVPRHVVAFEGDQFAQGGEVVILIHRAKGIFSGTSVTAYERRTSVSGPSPPCSS